MESSVRGVWESLATLGRKVPHYIASEVGSDSIHPGNVDQKRQEDRKRQEGKSAKPGERKRKREGPPEGGTPEELDIVGYLQAARELLAWASEAGLVPAEHFRRRALLEELVGGLAGLVVAHWARRDADLRALDLGAALLCVLADGHTNKALFNGRLRDTLLQSLRDLVGADPRRFLHLMGRCLLTWQGPLEKSTALPHPAVKLAQEWYHRKPSKEVAVAVARIAGYDRYPGHKSLLTHSQLVRKAHLHAEDPAVRLIFDFVRQGSVPDAREVGEGAEVSAVREVLLVRDRLRARDWSEAEAAAMVVGREWVRREMVHAMYWCRGGAVEEALLGRDKAERLVEAAASMTVRGQLRPELYAKRRDEHRAVGQGSRHKYAPKLSHAERQATGSLAAYKAALAAADLSRVPLGWLFLKSLRYQKELGALKAANRRAEKVQNPKGKKKSTSTKIEASAVVSEALGETVRRGLNEAEKLRKGPLLFLSLDASCADFALYSCQPLKALEAVVLVQLRLGVSTPLRAFPTLRAALTEESLAKEEEREVVQAMAEDPTEGLARDLEEVALFCDGALGDRPAVVSQIRQDMHRLSLDPEPNNNNNKAKSTKSKGSKKTKAPPRGVCFPNYPVRGGLDLRSGEMVAEWEALRGGERELERLCGLLKPCLPQHTWRQPLDPRAVFASDAYAGQDLVLLVAHHQKGMLGEFHSALVEERAKRAKDIRAVLLFLFSQSHHDVHRKEKVEADAGLLVVSNFDGRVPDIVAHFLRR